MQHKLIKKVQDEIFDPSQLDQYCLLISIGTGDVQLAVIDVSKRRCLLVEEYALSGISTQSERLKLLQMLFSQHLFIRGGFWKSVKFSLKGHKFSLVPRALYSKDSAPYYFTLNASLNKGECLFAYPHKSSDTVNVFAADHTLVTWLTTLYPSKKITITHQGSAIIEGSMRLYGQQKGKSMVFLIDKKLLHAVVLEQGRLFYYNQFSIQDVNALVKYVLLVFKELNMVQQRSPVTLYGSVVGNAPYVMQLRQQLQLLTLGKRPNFVQYPFPFDDVPNHHYFDLVNTYLCQGFYPV